MVFMWDLIQQPEDIEIFLRVLLPERHQKDGHIFEI